MKYYQYPKIPSERYKQDVVWLIAFRDCGWEGKRAIEAADKALAEYLKGKKP